jgi:hypothetical protein
MIMKRLEHLLYVLSGVDTLFYSSFTDGEKEMLTKNVYKENVFRRGKLTGIKYVSFGLKNRK